MNTGFILVLLTICACVSAQTPDYCNNNECPTFTVVKETENYQLRVYQPIKWVETQSVINNNWTEVETVLIKKLFAYIRGDNDIGATIAMGVPVLTKIQPITDLNPQMVMTKAFLIPSSLRPNTPIPTDRDVTLVSWPEREIYVRSFCGVGDREEIMYHSARLRSAIGNDALYDNTYVIKAAFDPPQKLHNRHNELWLVKNTP